MSSTTMPLSGMLNGLMTRRILTATWGIYSPWDQQRETCTLRGMLVIISLVNTWVALVKSQSVLFQITSMSSASVLHDALSPSLSHSSRSTKIKSHPILDELIETAKLLAAHNGHFRLPGHTLHVELHYHVTNISWAQILRDAQKILLG